MLFNVRKNEWDAELLKLLDIPIELMPRVLPSSAAYGETRPSLLGAAIAIGGVAGDQQSALFGQACFKEGMAKNTYGTGCFMLMHTGAKFQTSANGLLTTSAAQVSALTEFATEGSVFVGGAVVQWLRDGLKIIRTSADVDALARSVSDNGGVYLVPAFAGLGAPHWDAYARGAIFGLTRGATGGHIARAALEAIAFQSADVLAAMERDAGITLTELRVDGGATANDLLLQFQADILGVPVVRSRVRETTALGAAYLAGLAVGYWKSDTDIASHWQVDRRFEPAMPRERVAALRAEWEKAVSRAMAWAQP
jgi:glycerol kinase